MGWGSEGSLTDELDDILLFKGGKGGKGKIRGVFGATGGSGTR